MSTKPSKRSMNFYTAVTLDYSPQAAERVEKQSIADLISTDTKMLTEMLTRRGFRPIIDGEPTFIDKNGKDPDHETDPAAHFAAGALLLFARFSRAWGVNYSRAAEYAYIAGQYRSFAVMHDRKAAVTKKSRAAGKANASVRDAKLVDDAVNRCVAARRKISMTDLHEWFFGNTAKKEKRKPVISASHYKRVLRDGKFAEKVATALESVLRSAP